MKKLNKGALLASMGVATLATLSSCMAEEQKTQRYNIIHIMTDDHAWQAISAYEHPISKVAATPNIDRIAQQGMLFTQGCVENSISAPSRATLLTGMYSHNHGQKTLDKGFKQENIMLSELMQEAGYQTAIVGKWHLPVDPKGFDYYKILDDQGDYYNPSFRTKQTDGQFIHEKGYVTTLITDDAIGWLETRDASQPFCLFVHHKAPHRNWMPERKYLDLYEDVEFPYPETLFDDYATRGEATRGQEMSIENVLSLRYDLKVQEIVDDPIEKRVGWLKAEWEKVWNTLTEAEKQAWNNSYSPRNRAFLEANLIGDELVKWKYQRYLRDYMRTIKSVDEQVGRLLDYLEENGMKENTLVVYTSDQGFYLGEHGWFDKRFMYSESMRTPILAMLPGKIPAGVKIDKLVQNIDFAPTYLDFAGADVASQMDGQSAKQIMLGDTPQEWRSSLYYHYYDYPAIHMVRKHDGVYDGRYKLINFYGEGGLSQTGIDVDYFEFFDLHQDPNELNNLYSDPSYAIEIGRMKEQLNQYRSDLKIVKE